MERRRQHMDPTLFESIVDQAAGSVEFAWLHLFGEPFLNPRFPAMVCYARENGQGMGLGTSTNVTLLRGRLLEAAATLPLDVLLLSVDGIAPASYERIRVRGQFDAVLESVGRFAEIWSAAAERPRHVVLSFIDLPAIEEDVAAARAFWEARLPAEFVVNLKPYHPWGYQDALVTGIAREVGHLQAPPSLRGRRCHEFWRGFTVLSDGRCVPCCNDYEGRLVLGDLTRQSLEEVWNGPVMRRLRGDEQLDNPLCRYCPQYSPSERDALLEVSPFDPWSELRGYLA
jgi:MoaA/NifB/PqqE/SkfB family radical SAM enzyme